MARRLKTYQTSIGFFDLAVAAPSMKAALQIWGADSNLFHQGFAKEVDDSAVVAATVAHPGTVLRRPVGTDGAFKETSDLPKDLTHGRVATASRKPPASPVKPARAAKTADVAGRKAAEAFDRRQRKREESERREELARAKEQERRSARIAKAQKALGAAEQEHDARDADLQDERDKIDKRADAERQRWESQRDKLRAALHRAKRDRV
jgi:hypothetical protein